MLTGAGSLVTRRCVAAVPGSVSPNVSAPPGGHSGQQRFATASLGRNAHRKKVTSFLSRMSGLLVFMLHLESSKRYLVYVK